MWWAVEDNLAALWRMELRRSTLSLSSRVVLQGRESALE